MQRRTFIELLTAGIITTGLGIAAGIELPHLLRGESKFGLGKMGPPLPSIPPDTHPYPSAIPIIFEPPLVTKVPVPFGTINSIPDHPGMFALTVDDGISTEVVREYTRFCQRTGMRLTFFVTGQYSSWTENIPELRPLVESGQIQMANHTWTHPSLTDTSADRVISELNMTHEFLQNNYGVDGRPYFRPPFGNHDARVDSIAASLGYTTPVMWYGSLSDAGQISADQLREFAGKWIGEKRIVIGHANFPAVIECMDYIKDLILDRKLQPVTLNDLYTHA